MSGVAIIRYLLSHNAGVLAVVPADRIKAGDLRLTVVLPAISVKKIDGMRRENVAADARKRMWRERVQVSPLVKDPFATPAGTGYAGVDQLLDLCVEALPCTRGLVNGIYCDSILPDLEGPDEFDEVDGIHSGSQDFMVVWIAD